MPSDKHNDDNTYTVTLTLSELLAIENWGDAYIDNPDPMRQRAKDLAGGGFTDVEQQLYDRISGARIELEVHAGTHGA
jgi:hypothetical protein